MGLLVCFGELTIAHILICSFHVGLNDQNEPLFNYLETLISVHTAHIGLCTFLFREVFLVLEGDRYLEDIHFEHISGQIGRHERSELSWYLERLA